MTSNRDRAVEVMRNFWHDGRYAVGFDEIADALAGAGLLTPDLPEPDGHGRWFAGADGIEVHDGMVFHAHGLTGRDLDPEVARALALALLAAANHAEAQE